MNNDSNIGVWLIGARGGVASTAILGLAAIKRGLIGSAGLVSQLPLFQHLRLADWGRFVVGGHEIRRAPLVGEVAQIADQSRIPMTGLLDKCRPEFEEIDRRIRPGTVIGVGETIASLADLDMPRDETPRDHRPAGRRHGRVRPRAKDRASGGGQHLLDRAGGGRFAAAGDLGGTGRDAGHAVRRGQSHFRSG